ncbi:MAG: MFS transporter [Microgenomates group bacterium]
MWFLAGNWIFYWLRFMTYGQLGVMDATCFLFGLIMEVPSGAIADVIGKRKTVVIGMFLAALGFLFMGTAVGLPTLWVGFLLAQAGWAFYSGAAEALTYDSLVDLKCENQFEKVITASGSVATITSLTATLLGGVMYVLYWRSTHLGMAIAFFVAFLVALGLTEPKTDTNKFSFKIWWSSLIDGSRQLLLPALKPFIIVMLMLMGAEYLYEWGLVKPAIATSFGFLDRGQAVLYTIFGLINAVLVRYIPTIRKWVGDEKGLYLLTVFMGLGFLMAALPIGYFGLLPMLIITISGYLVYPWISIVVNKEIEAKHRATALSTVALITKIPYVLVAVIAGRMAQGGELWKFNVWVGGVIIGAMLLNIVIAKVNDLRGQSSQA